LFIFSMFNRRMSKIVPALVMSNGVPVEPAETPPATHETERAFVSTSNSEMLLRVAEQLGDLRRQLTEAEALWARQIALVDPANRASAVNLVHYWSIRQHDLRALQSQLAAFGLSSLGRSEPHVRNTLEAIAATVEALIGAPVARRDPLAEFGDGPRLLRRRAAELFGPAPLNRQTRIMVTLPPEAATDPKLVQELVEHGMEVARVNCAHDDSVAWALMIGHVRAATAATGRHCRVAMDLPGPKLRTGPLVPGPQVIKLKPTRNSVGVVTAVGYGWLTAAEDPQPPPRSGMATIRLPRSWIAQLQVKETIDLNDTREERRHLLVERTDVGGALVSTRQTTYVGTGTELRAHNGDRVTVTALPAIEQFLTLQVGDELVLTRDCSPAPMPTGGHPARIGCTLPEAFGHVQVGHAVHLDDGKMSAEVIAAAEDQFTVRITTAAVNGSRLRAAKGINLPDTFLPVPALTNADRENLPFVSEHADIVEMSFARSAQDVADLLVALTDLGDQRLGIVLKIETAQGFSNLPAILLAAMQRRHTGVMIARGDLAGECGYERLAELQEEIMWLAEAAHLPVIWATQVLDQLARTGQPSRAEITDAAMGVRAECVMLNKGPHILDAVDTLADILERMTGHHDKKNALMRPLRSWRLHRSTGST
jgi:pyruvate kinase